MNRKAFGASFLHWVDFTRITRTPKKSVIYYVYIFINKIQLRILHVQQITTCYNLPSNFLSDFNDDIINFNCFHPVYLQLIGIDLSQMRSLFWREELYIVGTYLKLIYSEKATKFCEISTNYFTGSTKNWQYIGQIIGEDFAKFCGLLRMYELYN